jgi:hypothetical protein
VILEPLTLDLSAVSDEHLAALFAAVSVAGTVEGLPAEQRQQAYDWLTLAGREIHRRFLAARPPVTDEAATLPF